ncbi:MAG: pyruvate formate lyase family protein, partial [Promethearchaeota archaeon]
MLKKGILGVKEDAEERLDRLDLTNPEDFKKLTFLQGVIIALEAAAEIGQRFAKKARELAEQEGDTRRKTELLKIAEVCDQVPAHPARNFYEAIQSVWFVHIMHALDNEHASGMGPGRPDQYMYPYYERDIAEGRITKEEAQELIDCWFMRYSQYYVIWRSDAGSYGTHTPHTPGHHLDVGGLKPDGTDGANELSYMFIEAMMHTTGMTEPTLGLLVHSKTPEDLLIKACQLTALGGGYPMFINQDLRVGNLLARNEIMDGPPISLELARKGTGAGCHEL